GGLTLPEASFEYALTDNQLAVTNTTTVDPSFTPEEVLYQWTFKKLDLGTVVEWKTWEQTDQLVIDDAAGEQPPLWVQDSLLFEPSNLATGVLSREVV